MNIEEAIALQKKLFERRMAIRKLKGEDYAHNDNIHYNFETGAAIAKLLEIDITTPWGVAMFYEILKIQRECNLLFNNKVPNNESILDTIIDNINYGDLRLEMLVKHGVVKIDDI